NDKGDQQRHRKLCAFCSVGQCADPSPADSGGARGNASAYNASPAFTRIAVRAVSPRRSGLNFFANRALSAEKRWTSRPDLRKRWPSRLVATAAATREMKAPRIDPGLRELVGLSLLSGGGCSLALVQGDLLFVALFGAASIIAITETIRRLR